jgi:hypothetical protein
VAAASSLLLAAPVQRAKPPKFPAAVKDAFFEDARKQLVGERPKTTEGSGRPAIAVDNGGPDSSASSGGFNWSKLVDAETLEDEIKACQKALSEAVTVPEKFKGSGYKVGREQFSVAAAVFGVIAQFDGEVRWKQGAGGLRDAMAQAGANCKTASDQSFNEARARKDDLEKLVRGETVSLKPKSDEVTWDKVSHRPPLMKRLERGEQAIAQWTANSGEFQKNAERLRHEAQLVAMLAEIIQREKYEYSDDTAYLDYAKQLREGASAVSTAAANKSYEPARKGAGEMKKACAACHDEFKN